MPYYCDVCKITFEFRSYYFEHMKSHAGEKCYKCRICDSFFSKTSTRTEHELTHSSEKPHKCGTCGKSFAQSRYLRQHEKQHNEEKLFQCSVCNKCFNQARVLRQHQKIHEGKKFDCLTCGKSFLTARGLRDHLKTKKHSSDKSCQLAVRVEHDPLAGPVTCMTHTLTTSTNNIVSTVARISSTQGAATVEISESPHAITTVVHDQSGTESFVESKMGTRLNFNMGTGDMSQDEGDGRELFDFSMLLPPDV
ncbi:C2H2-type zinc finger protein [Candidatus Sororendozoicomonas aggregata]|uniref:C2H2-type zinc finger protein n=1 Tax=Candidatus Sororendozoicomonas aggregata TaxID=3073239 RepID=UPI002ED0071D